MLKKILVISVMALFVITGCKMNKYADVKEIFNEMIKIQEVYIAALEKAKDAKEVVAAMDAFGDSMVKEMPKIKELDKKYPELKNEKTPPKEIEAEYKKLQEVSEKLGKVSTDVMMKNAKDPEVMKAAQRMGEKMKALQ
jgi:hypothetical protein